ncbi:hypothetical protein [Paraliomyxa miuraensis]|uniref:hypothetical protein n=1 Tax=Paraliomyxa miuraensis TaxID=376150 RepID=UPI0022577EE6|nr:hypothetical protein [Paraliomyxa miuraensis]MCX4246602.1 hypothetical protein [Paraliomyxa miuraensis]
MQRALKLAMTMAMTMTMTMAACDDGPAELEDLQTELDQDGLEHEVHSELRAPAATQAVVTAPQVTVVAWSDGDDIRATASCTDYSLYAADTTRCYCDGLAELGHTGYGEGGADIKCKMCTDGGGWPCTLTPNNGSREVELTFADADGTTSYSYVDEANQVAPVDPPSGSEWVLSCDEPPASCHYTCDPGGEPCTCGEDFLEFAVVRPYWQGGVRHITAEGGFHISLGAGAC